MLPYRGRDMCLILYACCQIAKFRDNSLPLGNAVSLSNSNDHFLPPRMNNIQPLTTILQGPISEFGGNVAFGCPNRLVTVLGYYIAMYSYRRHSRWHKL
jgi:hypothetical protein